MIVAGTYQTFETFLDKSTPSHTKGRGFDATLDIVINLDGTISLTSDTDIFLTHSLLQWLAWGVLGSLQIITNRYFKQHYKAATWTHMCSGISIVILSIYATLLVLKR
jgi:hypothetical protein